MFHHPSYRCTNGAQSSAQFITYEHDIRITCTELYILLACTYQVGLQARKCTVVRKVYIGILQPHMNRLPQLKVRMPADEGLHG